MRVDSFVVVDESKVEWRRGKVKSVTTEPRDFTIITLGIAAPPISLACEPSAVMRRWHRYLHYQEAW